MAGNVSTLGIGGSAAVSAIHNYFSAGGVNSLNPIVAAPDNNLKQVLSGALTATELATVLSVTGHGKLNLACAYAMDATPRTIRAQVIVDGRTIFDATSDTIAAQYHGLVMVGVVDSGATAISNVFQPIEFYQTLVIKIASSLSEDNKIAVGTNYEVFV